MLEGHAACVEHLTGYMEPVFSIPFDWELSRLPHVTEAEMPAIAAATRRAGVWNCPTVAMMMQGAVDSNLTELILKMVKALSDSGAGLLLGTDDGFLTGRLNIDDELWELVNIGLTPYKALETGTRNVARFFGTLDSTGTIAVGKRADLVLLNGNPLRDITNVEKPAGIILRGQWLPRDVLDARIAAAKQIAEAAEAERAAAEGKKAAGAAAAGRDTTP